MAISRTARGMSSSHVIARTDRPAWVSDRLYPFASRWFETPRGWIHYIDEGQGTPLVFVHGNPSWSFEYRGPILALRDRYRCIALDHLGFGLSQRGADPGGDHPRVHARNFAALLDHLALDGMVLIFSDWGGPIALSAARLMPDRVCGFVVLNSWCWPVPHCQVKSLGSATGWPRSGISAALSRQSPPCCCGDAKTLPFAAISCGFGRRRSPRAPPGNCTAAGILSPRWQSTHDLPSAVRPRSMTID
ncbi:hypothetical protein CCR91_10245 [Thiorhodovibrio winogradskyi]|nr:hypothetical protein [Thiorhodovibrio winogradskyi]